MVTLCFAEGEFREFERLRQEHGEYRVSTSYWCTHSKRATYGNGTTTIPVYMILDASMSIIS